MKFQLRFNSFENKQQNFPALIFDKKILKSSKNQDVTTLPPLKGISSPRFGLIIEWVQENLSMDLHTSYSFAFCAVMGLDLRVSSTLPKFDHLRGNSLLSWILYFMRACKVDADDTTSMIPLQSWRVALRTSPTIFRSFFS